MTTSPLTVAVLGPGGVGGLIGGLLARDGHRVVCLAGEDTAAAIARDGLHVRSARFGEFTARVEAATELREPVDAAFVTVKETALAAALDRMPPAALGTGVVVPLLNGLDHMARLREHYPAGRVVAGTIRVEATRTAPGRIEHGSPFATIELGAPAEHAATVGEFAEQLRHAGLDVTLRADETAMLWSKLSFLAPFALLTTRHASAIGAVRTEHRAELVAVLDEITAVTRAVGAPADAQALLADFDRIPGTMKSSMQRDVEAGRPTELDAIGGAVLRAADAHGVAAPTIARLVRDLSEHADR
ncbi:ketopantoate reductase family protein [Streptomyces sp. CBMA156]|uniref:ketopantoate reductase family protein n=1 Tax=Streptomyces sp. CBMA156 TaxID=1930280 RepID=UPI001661FE6D|nr:2-dehydropantoate 2-reductase [Streptomyces sp. CBMA156]MBD0669330.1 2-dehydropantoate 2-reductase [Streptomyces sp. CBMA156]